MLIKSYLKTKKGICKVTFELPADVEAKSAVVVGDFNNWDPTATPMKRKRDGRLSVSINLPSGREYRFKYYLDQSRWLNDPNPDRLVPNPFGSFDSVIVL